MNVQAKVVKVDADRRLVFGWANIAVRKDGTQVIDAHNEAIDPDDLEHAAYQFTLAYREMNANHQEGQLGYLVESFMVTDQKLMAMGLDPTSVDKGWWVGFYVEDDTAWAAIKKGEFSMFSIEGTAVPTEDA